MIVLTVLGVGGLNTYMITKIYITLGHSCNMNCIYCKQEHIEYFDITPSQILIDRITELPQNINICFFGGEPLIYLKQLLMVVDTISSSKKNVTFGVITNGKLLTEDIVEIFNTKNISVTISHDGSVQSKTRMYDPLINNIDFITKIKRKSISSVISGVNPDIYKVWDFFDELEQEHNTKFPVHFEFIKNFGQSIEEELLLLNNDIFEKSLDRLFFTLIHQVKNSVFDSREFNFITNILKGVQFRLNLKKPQPPCLVGYNVAHTDLQGNMYACHDSLEIIGNIENGICAGSNLNLSEKCKACYLLTYCGGGCILTSGAGKEHECYINTQLYSRLDSFLTYIQFNPELIDKLTRGTNDSSI